MSQNRKPQAPQVQLNKLLKRVDELTSALHRMANSNEQLVAALMSQEEPRDQDEPTHYMDGSPMQ